MSNAVIVPYDTIKISDQHCVSKLAVVRLISNGYTQARWINKKQSFPKLKTSRPIINYEEDMKAIGLNPKLFLFDEIFPVLGGLYHSRIEHKNYPNDLGHDSTILDLGLCVNGLRAMEKNHCAIFNEFMAGNTGPTMGDNFLQCCVYGKVSFRYFSQGPISKLE